MNEGEEEENLLVVIQGDIKSAIFDAVSWIRKSSNLREHAIFKNLVTPEGALFPCWFEYGWNDKTQGRVFRKIFLKNCGTLTGLGPKKGLFLVKIGQKNFLKIAKVTNPF